MTKPSNQSCACKDDHNCKEVTFIHGLDNLKQGRGR